MRIAEFRCPIADLALKKENLKFKLANRKSKYYLLPNYNPQKPNYADTNYNQYIYTKLLIFPSRKISG